MYEAQLHDLFEAKKLGYQFKTIDGDLLEVIEFGERNFDAGPDFKFAKVRHKGLEWSGHIEFHLKSSDWFRHQHQHDVNYTNVIAHFVMSHDKVVKSGEYVLPTIELQSQLRKSHLKEKQEKLSCQSQLESIAKEQFQAQQEQALKQRLERKLEEASNVFKQFPSTPLRAAALIVASQISPKVNQESFRSLIQEIPEKLFMSQLNAYEWEAVLFRLSGLMPTKTQDGHINQLNQIANEYELSSKMSSTNWKYATMRPTSQPIFKIAQLACILEYLQGSKELHISANELRKLKLTDYWQTHLNFQKESKVASVKLGQALIEKLRINAFFPIEAIVRYKTKQAQLSFYKSSLEKTKPEVNKVVTKMKAYGFSNDTAADSQALIEQKNELCERKKCLLCKIGQSLLKA